MTTGELGPAASTGATATRWRRYGRDRLYVKAPDGSQLGYRDLSTGLDHVELPEYAGVVADVANSWQATQAVPSANAIDIDTPIAPAPVSEGAPPRPWFDLSLNRPGAAAREQALARRAEAPVKTALARLLGVHTDERAWRVGADGEELVAKQLARLAKRNPLWTTIHAIPVGKRGSDIDHLVLGPGGVFTINTKCHPNASIWVGGDTFMVNGTRTPYVRNARHEALRASRLLEQAGGSPVHVEALIVPVLCNLPTVKSQPGNGVRVVARRRLADWLLGLGTVLATEQLSVIWEHARRSTTWEG